MPNLCGNYINEANGKMSPENEDKLVWASSSVLGGGLDTVSSFLSHFVESYMINIVLEHVQCLVLLHGHDLISEGSSKGAGGN